MNSGLETCRKDAFRLYNTVYKDSVFYHLLWHLNIVEKAADQICLPRDSTSTCENPCACLMKSVLACRRWNVTHFNQPQSCRQLYYVVCEQLTCASMCLSIVQVYSYILTTWRPSLLSSVNQHEQWVVRIFGSVNYLKFASRFLGHMWNRCACASSVLFAPRMPLDQYGFHFHGRFGFGKIASDLAFLTTK